MQTNDVIHSFRVTRVREISELDGTVYEFVHEKTGAELVWIAREDENRTFAIAFKTIPEDSTGVFHILEHSVLCGSEKYPVKDPFVELLKSSVNTFLNAMTYPDKTVYPISSRNHKDFMNLMDIYLDAVLNPKIYEKPEIFRQEGWRYEFDGEGRAQLQGVVLNEMKGAYSSVGAVLENAMNKLMFPTSPYGYESGGCPENIPDLTYDEFIAMHRKYYHPSNARIVLVGSVEIEEALALIESFLNKYDRIDADFSIPYEGRITYSEQETPYEIGPEESPEGRTVIATGYKLCRFDEKEKIFAASILADYLAGDNDAPLKKAILSRSLGQEVSVTLHDGIQEPWMSWEIRNTDRDKLDEIKSVITGVISELAENGLDRERLEASYSSYAFRVRDREATFALSLAEAMTTLDSWLYGGDPTLFLTVEELLDSMEKNLDTGYFEKLLREIFLDNTDSACAILVPSNTLGAEKAAEEAKRLSEIQSSWSDAELAEKKAELAALRAWQETPDSPEALATIPVLKLSDLDRKVEDLRPEVGEEDGFTVLTHKFDTKLVTLHLVFNVSDLSDGEIPAVELMINLLGKLGTAGRSSEQLRIAIKKFGNRFVHSLITSKSRDTAAFYLIGGFTSLPSRQKEAADVTAEILTETDFSDLDAVRTILKQEILSWRQSAISSGHALGVTQARASVCVEGLITERKTGLSYYKLLKKLDAASDEELTAYLGRIKELMGRIFSRRRMLVGRSENLEEGIWQSLADRLPEGEPGPEKCRFEPEKPRRLGIVIPAQVGYAVKAACRDKPGRGFSGSEYVLQNILNFSYLWSEIRVLGGAYGCGYSHRSDLTAVFYSYRDPKPERSLRVFDGAADFLRSYLDSKPDLTAPILGAYSSINPHISSKTRMLYAEGRYLKGDTYEYLCRQLDQFLATDAAALEAFIPLLEDHAAEGTVAVVAGKQLIDSFGIEFDAVESI